MAQVNQVLLGAAENAALKKSNTTMSQANAINQSQAIANSRTTSDNVDTEFSTILAVEYVNPIREITSILPSQTPTFAELLTDDLSDNANGDNESTPEDLLAQIGIAQSYNAELDNVSKISGQILPSLPQTEFTTETNTQLQAVFSDDLSSVPQLVNTDGIETLALKTDVNTMGAEQEQQNFAATSYSISQSKLASVTTSPQVLANSIGNTDDASTKALGNQELVNTLIDKTQSSDVDGKAGIAKALNQTIFNETTKQTPIIMSAKLASEQMVGEFTESDFQVDDSDLLSSFDKASSNSQSNTSTFTNGLNFVNRAEARSDIPQLHVSLKQAGEQTPPMQEMIQRFSPVMKQQLVAMVSNGIGQAEIRLDPPELGHMLVKIQVQQDQTQVQFHVSQPGAKELLEQATPKLREMLAEQGIELSDSQVSYREKSHDGSSQEQDRQGSQQGDNSSMNSGWNETATNDEQLVLNMPTSEASGIDYYA